MASDGSDSVPSQDQRDHGSHLRDASRSETGVSAEPLSKDTLKTTAESEQRDEDGVKVCPFFLAGKCHFGHRCHLSHRAASVDDSAAVTPDGDDNRRREKTENKKPAKPKHEATEVNKKPRMRTADDVISRILWDPSVDASHFVVGYVDRFLGVLERPFKEFNWDADPCDCDYTSELALPRHRIQYFTYRGHRVWDRHTRTDRVFGSTGQSLAPPFGGEEEVKGENAEKQQQQEDLKKIEEQPASVCGQSGTDEWSHSEKTHLEEDGRGEMTVRTPDSAQPSLTGGRSSQEHKSGGGRVAEEAAFSPNALTEQMSFSHKEGERVQEEADEESCESCEGNEEASNNLEALNISQSSPAEQREEKCGVRPAKKRPTHFITFRANTPAILSCFQQLQKEITSLLPSSAPHWQTSSSLHVTLCLLVLAGPAEVAAAAAILQRFAQFDRNPPVAVTFPARLKHFNGKVLFLSPQPQLPLQQLNSGLQEAYRKEGWLHRDSYNPRYHLTLAKVEGREEGRVFEGVGDLKVGKGLNFGRLPVNTLHLCAMGGSKVDGFYERVCTVTLR